MRAWRQVALASLIGLGAGGCNDQFAFDEHPIVDAQEPAADAQQPGVDAAIDARLALPDAGGAPDGAVVSPDAPDPQGGVDAGGPATCGAQTPSCQCSGPLCSCARQQWCRFTGEVCTVPGRQCTFLCHNGSRCEGQCQRNCKLECEHESDCTMTMGDSSFVEVESSVVTVTVGAMSTIHCENNATCHIVCTGACVLECQSGSRCDLRCPGDAAPRSADMGGSCP